MHKKLMMACMAIAAFAALVIAPMASASPVLTSSGTTVPVGASITGRSTGNVRMGFPADGTSVHWKGTLTKNTGTKFGFEVPSGSALFTGTGTGGDFTSALGATKVTMNSKLCLETVTAADNVSVTGCGANVTFTLEVTGTGPCKYSAASMTGTFVTNAGATFNLNEQPASKEEGGIFCPSTSSLTTDVDLYTTNGTTLTVS